MDINQISKALKKLRIKSGLSLYQLARRADTSAATLSKYEKGWDRFEIYTLNKIANSLGCRVEIEFVPVKQKRAPATLSGTIKKLSRLFWDKKLKKNDFSKYPIWIVERVIEFGSLEDIYSLINVMGRNVFLRYVSKCRFQSKKTKSFWEAMLNKEGIKCMKRSFPREALSY